MDSIFENMYVNKELFAAMFDPLCEQYDLTVAEILVLMYLGKNEVHNTATDIVHKLKIAKSYVSTSVRELERRGYIACYQTEQNRRSIHLQLCPQAAEIVAAGEQAQTKFLRVLMQGFSAQEYVLVVDLLRRMTENANAYLQT